MSDADLASARDTIRSAHRWSDLLSESQRRKMLGDIARIAFAIGRDLYPEQDFQDRDVVFAGDGGQHPPVPRERLAFLRASWSRLERALTILESEPASALVAGSRSVPLERARRVRPKDLLESLRGDNLVPVASNARGGSLLARALNGMLPRRVAEAIAMPTFDAPANRAIKTILSFLGRDLKAIAAIATAQKEGSVARDAEWLRNRVRRHLRRSPWQALLPLPAVPTLPPALRTNGSYRLLFDFWRHYRRGFAFDWDNSIFTLPARETWRLYELWAFFQTAQALRALGFQTQQSDGFSRTPIGSLRFVLMEPEVPPRLVFHSSGGAGEKQTVVLSYNRRFRRGDAAGNAARSHSWHSRSHGMQPDIALESQNRLLLLDAKFKTYSERDSADEWQFRDGTLVPDIRQMHGYRDALARGLERNVVWGAWLLFAGRRTADGPALVAYPRRLTEPHDAYPQQFGNREVGALRLRPDDGGELLQELIREFLFRPNVPYNHPDRAS